MCEVDLHVEKIEPTAESQVETRPNRWKNEIEVHCCSKHGEDKHESHHKLIYRISEHKLTKMKNTQPMNKDIGIHTR